MKSSIYTGQGDTGFTRLADNTKIGKDSLRLDAYGTIDEAGAHIALAISLVKDNKLLQILTFVTHKLFNCSSNLAFSSGSGENVPKLKDEDVKFLENSIDYLESVSGLIQGFILCGGADAREASTRLHVARTVIRRAERFIIKLDKTENNVDKTLLKFINRTSDLLFAAARYENSINNKKDIFWDKNILPPNLKF